MYFPYLRGKQNELILVRDNADLLSGASFTPIIEPVKSAMNGLRRSLDAVVEANGSVIVIVNPHHGDFKNDGEDISLFIEEHYSDEENICIGIILEANTSLDELEELYTRHEDKDIYLIHAGFDSGKVLANFLDKNEYEANHVFIEDHCGRLYRRHFIGNKCILIRDAFERKNNREYNPVDFFSDLHLTYGKGPGGEGMDGFGDFLIVGDEYSESGGPAYAVTLHLTFIDENKEDAMYIHHFVSIRQDTPKDPGGKFLEALDKLIAEIDKPNTQILETNAVTEFLDLHDREHFPGLGYVKKLSMQHHIETLADYLS